MTHQPDNVVEINFDAALRRQWKEDLASGATNMDFKTWLFTERLSGLCISDESVAKAEADVECVQTGPYGPQGANAREGEPL